MKQLFLFILSLFIVTTLTAQERGFKPIREVTGKSSYEIENRYHALIIGNNDYNDEAINDLDNPIPDAQKLYDVLTESYTFKKENVVF